MDLSVECVKSSFYKIGLIFLNIKIALKKKKYYITYY